MTDPIRPISTRRPDIALTLLTDGSESFPCGKLVISRSLGMVEVEVEGGGEEADHTRQEKRSCEAFEHVVAISLPR